MIIMNIHNSTFRKGIMLLLLLCGTLSAAAQWAGPDQEVLRNDDNSQTVTLSVLNPQPNACYVWTGDNIQGDNKLPTITANPQAETCLYRCKCISALGVDEDEVSVKVLDSIQIVSVEPIKECFQDGDDVNTTQFKIVTKPEGHESEVTLTPIRAYASLGNDKMEVTFSLNHNGHTSTATANVDVINATEKFDMNHSTSAKRLYELIKAGKVLADKAATFSTKLNTLTKLFEASPCQPDWDLTWNLTAPFAFTNACCDDKTAEVLQFRLSSGCDLSGGLDCAFPFAGIPYVASANVVIGVNLGVGISPCYIQMGWETPCFEAVIPVNLYFNLSGGVGISLLSPNVLSADIRLQGGLSKQVQWNIGKEIQWGNTKVSVAFVGQVKTLGLFTESVSYTFWETTL